MILHGEARAVWLGVYRSAAFDELWMLWLLLLSVDLLVLRKVVLHSVTGIMYCMWENVRMVIQMYNSHAD